jgi:cytochrome c biogenesis protein CcmG/thiol:disulfide interchange protein DsbE
MQSSIERQLPGAAPAQTGRGGRPALGNRLRTVAIMAVTGALILAAAALANKPTSASGVTLVDLTGIASGPAPIVGEIAPDFTATTIDGSEVRLADLRGSTVWLTFGASWCQPCRSENPDIKAAYETFRDRGVVVVQIYINEDEASVAEYAARLGLPYVKVADTSDQIASNYRILGIPAHFFVDRDGVLRQMRVGTLDAGAMSSILTELAG